MILGTAQTEFIGDYAKGGRGFYIAEGAVRSGKTAAATMAFTMKALAEGGNYIVAGRSMGSVKRNILPELQNACKGLGGELMISWADSTGRIGDTTFHFFGATNEKSQDTLQGFTASGAFLDEALLMPMSFIQQAQARCSVEGASVMMTMNPESPFHPVKTDYIDRADEINACVRKFVMDDNPGLSEERKKFYATSFRGVFYRRYVLGEWCAAEGAIYREFETQALDPNATYSAYNIAVDFGMATTTAAVVLGQVKGKEYALDEYYHDAKKTDIQLPVGKHADNIVRLAAKYPKCNVYCDPSAAVLKRELRDRGLTVRDGVNDVVEGIRVVDEMLASKRLIIGDNCLNLIAELYNYRWDEGKQAIGEDAPMKENDHACDAMRYYIFPRYRSAAWRGNISKPKGF